MRAVEAFKLVPRAPAGCGESDLWRGDRCVVEGLAGTALEAQYEVDDGGPAFVLLTSYDLPFEETLHAFLLDEEGRVVESAKLGAPYAPGVLENVHVDDEWPNTLAFDFQGPVLLTVHDFPRGALHRRLEIARPEDRPVSSRPPPSVRRPS